MLNDIYSKGNQEEIAQVKEQIEAIKRAEQC